METQGSIRASLKGAKPTFRPQNIEPALLATAKQFLESFEFDMRIRRMLIPEKMEQSIGKFPYYLLGNEQRYEPGYIVCMKGHPIVFLHGRFQFGMPLRLRLHESVRTKEAIFIGTLDTVHASLRFEDVLYYEGKTLFREPFSKRYSVLRNFYENAFVQDLRLSGLNVSLAEVFSLSQLKELVESGQYHSIDLIPEMGGRNRFHIMLHPHTPSQTQRETQRKTQMPQKKPEDPEVNTSIPSDVSVPGEGERHTYAFAHKIIGLPDTYDLQNPEGSSIGKAAVQNAKVSMELRQAFMSAAIKSVRVNIEWHEDFQRYKILGIAVV